MRRLRPRVGTDDAPAARLAAAINNSNDYAAGAGSASAYFEVSAANRAILKNAGVVATVVGATVVVTAFAAIGGTTDEANGTFGTEKKVCLSGIRRSTLLRLPSEGLTVVKNDTLESDTGIQLRSSQQHGAGVWNKNANKIVKTYVVA